MFRHVHVASASFDSRSLSENAESRLQSADVSSRVGAFAGDTQNLSSIVPKGVFAHRAYWRLGISDRELGLPGLMSLPFRLTKKWPDTCGSSAVGVSLRYAGHGRPASDRDLGASSRGVDADGELSRAGLPRRPTLILSRVRLRVQLSAFSPGT